MPTPPESEAMRHMLEFLGWLLNCCDYQLNPNVMASVRRWAGVDDAFPAAS